MITKKMTWQNFPLKRKLYCFLLLRRITGRPEIFIGKSCINKEYFPSFAIIISTLITEKTPQGQLTPWAN